jgi:hypothetical protein
VGEPGVAAASRSWWAQARARHERRQRAPTEGCLNPRREGAHLGQPALRRAGDADAGGVSTMAHPVTGRRHRRNATSGGQQRREFCGRRLAAAGPLADVTSAVTPAGGY